MPPRDIDVLRDIETRRFMTSGHICKLRFGTASTPGSAQRIANRAINRLRGYGLIVELNRRIGGYRGGSGDNVWALTAAGYRLLHLGDNGKPRKCSFEPSQRFAEHTLSISELDVQLRGIDGIEVSEAQFEPACWRKYDGNTLKPDYFAVTTDGEYEDLWFFEVDLDTESPSRVLAKCDQYSAYYRSGMEQRDTGVFPRVVWVVPSGRRKETILDYIRRSRTLQYKQLFLVVLPDELPGIVQKGNGA